MAFAAFPSPFPTTSQMMDPGWLIVLPEKEFVVNDPIEGAESFGVVAAVVGPGRSG